MTGPYTHYHRHLFFVLGGKNTENNKMSPRLNFFLDEFMAHPILSLYIKNYLLSADLGNEILIIYLTHIIQQTIYLLIYATVQENFIFQKWSRRESNKIIVYRLGKQTRGFSKR